MVVFTTANHGQSDITGYTLLQIAVSVGLIVLFLYLSCNRQLIVTDIAQAYNFT